MKEKIQKKERKSEHEQILNLMKKIKEIQKDSSVSPSHSKQELHKLVKKNTRVLSSAIGMTGFRISLWSKSSWLKRKGLLLFTVCLFIGVACVGLVIGDWVTDFIGFIGVKVPDFIIDVVKLLFSVLIFFGLFKVWVKIWMPGFLLTANGILFVSSVIDKIHKKQST